jgi:hypothetical protein
VKRSGLALTAFVSVATALAGCGDEARPLDGRSLEASLVGAMNARLDGVEIETVDCVFLSRELTRCFAHGSAARRSFRLPASVRRRDGEMVWSVAEDDLRDARRGVEPDVLEPGDAVVVEGRGAERVQVRVREPIDPLDVTYPEVPPKYGSRYVAVEVDLRNRGASTYADRPLSRISATLSDGTLVTHASIAARECPSGRLGRTRIDPGERIRGCVAFEVPNRLELAGVALQLHYSESVVEWKLGRRSPAT